MDGSYGEGGGSIVRFGLALSAMTGKPVEVFDIRKKRKQPGLKTQHLVGARAIRDFTMGTLEGDELGSTRISFTPSPERQASTRAVISTAGSVGLLLQGLTLAASMRRTETFTLEIEGGGTYGTWAPSTTYLENVTFPVLRGTGVFVDLGVERHGFYPKGGARCRASFAPPRLPLKNREFVEFGKVTRIRGRVVVSRPLAGRRVAERVKSQVVRVLERDPASSNTPVSLETEYVESMNVGVGVDLWADTSSGGRPSSGTCLGARNLPSDVLGRRCAARLLDLVSKKVPVGEYLLDQIVPYLALAKGTSKIVAPQLTEHARTNLWLVSLFFPDFSWEVEDFAGRGIMLKIEGVGFRG
ncbi:MAG: RNA 3'-terminal phosphate cyclase [Promethearchaeota archaeon]